MDIGFGSVRPWDRSGVAPLLGTLGVVRCLCVGLKGTLSGVVALIGLAATARVDVECVWSVLRCPDLRRCWWWRDFTPNADSDCARWRPAAAQKPKGPPSTLGGPFAYEVVLSLVEKTYFFSTTAVNPVDSRPSPPLQISKPKKTLLKYMVLVMPRLLLTAS